MNSLVVTPFTPNTRTGRGNRTVGVIRALALLGTVDVAYVEFGGELDSSLLRDAAIELRKISPTRGFRRAFVYRRARAQGVPKDYASGLSRELLMALTETENKNFDRVVADGPTAASALLLLGKERPIYYNAQNLESALRAQLGNWSRKGLDELATFERRLLETAHESWFPSIRDMSGAAELAPHARLRLVPNVVNVASIAPVLTTERHQSALFIADYTYEPNRHSAEFLVSEVMPRVWKQLPQARLMLVGSGLTLTGELDSRVEVRGFVGDLPGVYAEAGCALVPLLESGGSPLKLLEAMAYGLPIVATPLAAGGVDGLESGVHFLEGEGADGFSAAVVHVLGGRTGDMGAAARKLAESEYSIEALARRLAE